MEIFEERKDTIAARTNNSESTFLAEYTINTRDSFSSSSVQIFLGFIDTLQICLRFEF